MAFRLSRRRRSGFRKDSWIQKVKKTHARMKELNPQATLAEAMREASYSVTEKKPNWRSLVAKHYRTMQMLNPDSTISDALRVSANELELFDFPTEQRPDQ